MKKPTDYENLFKEATRRSGKPDIIEYPVAAAGTAIVLCRLNDEDHREYMNGVLSQDSGVRATARNVALAKARIWPDQGEMNKAIAAVPGLDQALLDQVERLGGGDTAKLKIVDVRPALDDSAISALGIDPSALAAARRDYPNEGQLKIASYRDEELEIEWSCILRLPSQSSRDLMLENLHERGNETTVTFAVNALAWPGRDQAASFIRGQWRIASCLWPTLYSWAQRAAIARPTILRPKSLASMTSTAPPTSLEKSSETSA